MPAYTQASCTCPVHCPSEGLEERQRAAAQARTDDEVIQAHIAEANRRINPLAEFPDSIQYGLLTLKAPPDFRPDHAGAVLPNVIRYPQAGLSVALAPLLNASPWSQETGRWAVVADNGTLHFVTVPNHERPQTPDALPRDCEPWPGSCCGVQQAAAARNAERLKVARVPLEWTLAVRNLRHPRFAPPRPPGLELPAGEGGSSESGGKPCYFPSAVAELELPIELDVRRTGTPGEFALQVSQTIRIVDSRSQDDPSEVAGDVAAALSYLAENTDVAAGMIRKALDPHVTTLQGPHARPGEVSAPPSWRDVGSVKG